MKTLTTNQFCQCCDAEYSGEFVHYTPSKADFEICAVCEKMIKSTASTHEEEGEDGSDD